MEMQNYPCPECGSDGPHPVIEMRADSFLVECADCYAEFVVPKDVPG